MKVVALLNCIVTFLFISGENLNYFINENWREVSKDVAPAVVDALGEVLKSVFKSICDMVPYNNIVKP